MIACAALTSFADDRLVTAAGYRIPVKNHAFDFPRDHGSHPEFRIEWWYITGLMRDQAAACYGFQATFFRYALHPEAPAGSGSFGTNHLFMAHMALTDVNGQRFFHEERLNRDGWDAFASDTDMDLRNGNWTLKRTEGETMQLNFSIRSDVMLDLTLEPTQPHVLFGKDGLSIKGADPSAASWYITFPRLRVTGQMELYGKTLQLDGEAWMDHEISSSQLSKDQVGWDWLSVRFRDGQEMMLYILRDDQGNPDPFSTLAWIDEDGTLTQVGPDQFKWTPTGSWTSPETGATYPVDVTLEGTRPDGTPFAFTIKPLMRAQELVGKLGGIAYWEGACDIIEDGEPIGEGYMELTGYSDSLEPALR